MDAALAACAWSWSGEPVSTPVDGGLINHTWSLAVDGVIVAYLQRLNTRIFRAEVHEDIHAITTHLRLAGLETPCLLPTRAGTLWHTEPSGAVWRCLTPVGDSSRTLVTDGSVAQSAAFLVGRVHAALADLSWEFRMVRPGAHDTAKHMDLLDEAVRFHPGHRNHSEVAALAEGLVRAWGQWRGPTELPRRIIHGDLKLSNVRFRGPDAVALIDLDTFAWGSLDVELGDALRSWCNPGTEDAAEPEFRADFFEAVVRGYAAGAAGTTADEWDAIVPGTERIALELASRFARDALLESYFGYDRRFGTASDHNLLRARGQFALAKSIRRQRRDLDQALRTWRTS